MKIKIFLLFIIFPLTMSGLLAQNLFIISAGASLSTVRFDDTAAQQAIAPHLRPKTGYTIAAEWEHYFAPVLSLRTSASYIQKGFAYSYPYKQGYKTFNYLTFSVAGNLVLYRAPIMEISASVAPFTGYWLSGFKFEADYRGSALYAQKIVFSDSTYEYNRVDAGATLALHFKYWQSSAQAITLDIGLQYSAVSNDRHNVAGSRNRAIYFRIGYLWSL